MYYKTLGDFGDFTFPHFLKKPFSFIEKLFISVNV